MRPSSTPAGRPFGLGGNNIRQVVIDADRCARPLGGLPQTNAWVGPYGSVSSPGGCPVVLAVKTTLMCTLARRGSGAQQQPTLRRNGPTICAAGDFRIFCECPLCLAWN